jgi:hypothetical protein
METNDYNLLATLFTVIVIIISIVSMTVSIAQGVMTQSIAVEANKVAKMALEATMFDHKIKITPNISGKFQCLFIKEWPNNVNIVLFLSNESRGKAIVHWVSLGGEYFDIASHIYNKPIVFPMEVLYNEQKLFEILFENEISQELKKEFDLSKKDNEKSFYENFTNKYLQQAYVKVYYSDYLGNNYETSLYFDSSVDKHIGEPTELSKEEFEDLMKKNKLSKYYRSETK